MKMTNKEIILLVGPKGSGKSYIGSLIRENFNYTFLRVESWVKQMRNGRSVDDPGYLSEVFETIELGVRNALETEKKVVFESTGLTEYFDVMLTNLRRDFQVIIIGIVANAELCRNRVAALDQSIHINVSDEELHLINAHVRQKSIECDHHIINENKTKHEIIEELKTGILL